MSSRRILPFIAAGLAAACSPVRAADEVFDFEVLRYDAKMLAARPYAPKPSSVPEALLKLSYDQFRDIRFRPAESLWRRERLPFELQFFHPGFNFDQTVQINIVRAKTVDPVPFSPALFDYGMNRVPSVRSTMGFAGFRILYPLNKPGDEVGAFLGASYFRFLCQRAVYGLSARGLALNTGEPGGEEFPVFREFWVERPLPESKSLVVYALLDGPSVAGAYRFSIAPGAETVTDVHEVLYCRHNPAVLGLAPLTSMFWHGKNTNVSYDDFRPEVHDSDGLMIYTGAGEWIWRPLTNPNSARTVTFSDENPKGFGLVQRDRQFEDYQDLEAFYHMRPSAWIEPVGRWGKGGVRLVELHGADETTDNITAFWTPDSLPQPGDPIEVSYKIHWFMDQIHPPAGYAVATRIGRTRTHELDLDRFVVDFDGAYLNKQGPDPLIEPVVTVGPGAALVSSTVQKNPFNGTWRVAFALKPDGSGHPVELRCFLRKPPHVLTETWSYLWQP
ncbi:MAG TPA: glucan biosynthesis protein G [Candidatus Sulfotelmatobacter sp.]|nr:glucan biosynthesis protein G [Candidatus Sulfotelmatobacter sp.]